MVMCSGLLSFSFQVLLSILFLPLFVGALHVEVDFGDLEADFNFCSALLVKVDFVDLEATLIFLFAVLSF